MKRRTVRTLLKMTLVFDALLLLAVAADVAFLGGRNLLAAIVVFLVLTIVPTVLLMWKDPADEIWLVRVDSDAAVERKTVVPGGARR